MREPDVGTARGADIKFRCTAEEIAALDAKRGSVTRSAWLRAAIAQWAGPGERDVLVAPPIPEPSSVQFAPEAGIVTRTPGSAPRPMPPDVGKPDGRAATLPRPPMATHKCSVVETTRTWVRNGVLTHRLRCPECGKVKDIAVPSSKVSAGPVASAEDAGA